MTTWRACNDDSVRPGDDEPHSPHSARLNYVADSLHRNHIFFDCKVRDLWYKGLSAVKRLGTCPWRRGGCTRKGVRKSPMPLSKSFSSLRKVPQLFPVELLAGCGTSTATRPSRGPKPAFSQPAGFRGTRSGCDHARAKYFNERSQEVIENKADRLIANCKSQEVYENKDLIFVKPRGH
jgi:hypothetical protein